MPMSERTMDAMRKAVEAAVKSIEEITEDGPDVSAGELEELCSAVKIIKSAVKAKRMAMDKGQPASVV